MKKLFAMLLVLAMALTLLPTAALAAEEAALEPVVDEGGGADLYAGYYVTFDANGGRFVEHGDAATYVVGPMTSLSYVSYWLYGGEMVNEGREFQGWSRSRRGPADVNKSYVITLRQDMTFYAIWAEPEPEPEDVYQVVYRFHMLNGTETVPQGETLDAEGLAGFTAPATAVYQSYTFLYGATSVDEEAKAVYVDYDIDAVGTDGPDGVADKFQATVLYRAGGLEGETDREVLDVTDGSGQRATAGTITLAGVTAAAPEGYRFKSWRAETSFGYGWESGLDLTEERLSGKANAVGGEIYILTAQFVEGDRFGTLETVHHYLDLAGDEAGTVTERTSVRVDEAVSYTARPEYEETHYTLRNAEGEGALMTAEGAAIQVYYDLDELGRDDVADRFQALVTYVAQAGGSLTGETEQVVTLLAGEEPAEAGTVLRDETVTAQADEHYRSLGWDKDEAEAVGGGTVTFTARFEQITHTVTIDGEDQTVVDGETAVEPETPSREGYDFAGWFTEEGVRYDFSTPVTGDLVLTGRWDIQTFTVTVRFVDGEGTELAPAVTATVEYGGSYTAQALELEGYAPEGETSQTITVTEDREVVFVYTAETPDPVDPDPEDPDPETPDPVIPGPVVPVAPAPGGGNGGSSGSDEDLGDGVEDLEDPDVPLAEAPMLFTDVKEGDWYYRAVKTMFERELITGVTDTTFDPNGTMTRAMAVTILYRMAGSPAHNGGTFSDVVEGSWYADAVSWSDEHGIAVGYGDGTFGAQDLVTREQLATMLIRYERKIMGRPAGEWIFSLSNYWDASLIGGWAYEGMCWCVQQGILQGRNNVRLDPKGTASRAEAAMMLTRYLALNGMN